MTIQTELPEVETIRYALDREVAGRKVKTVEDPAGEMIPWTSFGSQVLARSMPLKDLLCDSSIVVGVGDVYSDEILFHAGLRHDRLSDSLSHQEVRRLHGALIQVVNDAIKYRGSDIEERPFRDLFGDPGVYGDHLAVYGRAGALSDRNRTQIQRIKYKGSWTYFCETQV